MNHMPRPTPEATKPDIASDGDTQAALVRRLRVVHRAQSELRRGVPVVLLGHINLAVLPAETADAASIADLCAIALAPPVLLLAGGRAEAVLGKTTENRIQAVILDRAELTPETLRALADPTISQADHIALRTTALPQDSDVALALLKIGRLLPAALVAPVGSAPFVMVDNLGLLTVPASSVREYPDAIAAQLQRVAEANVPLEDAPNARIIAFRAPDRGVEHLAIMVGHPETQEAPLVRVHSECFTGDLLGSLRCDCGPQLRSALRRMSDEGAGVLLYMAQEGRGIGLVNKLRAYALQDDGLDTLDANRALGWDADERRFLAAATMLDLLGIHRIRLLTNNPDKVASLEACGIDVAAREPHALPPNGVNDAYLDTKAKRFGHFL
jgi:GTP cyclohydrolase II